MTQQPLLNVGHDQRTNYRILNDLQGVYHHPGDGSTKRSLRAESGYTTNLYYDVDFWGQGGNICSDTGYTWKGENGLKHWQVSDFGVTAMTYPNTQVSGFRMVTNNNSTAGHALWCRHWAVVLDNVRGEEFMHTGRQLTEWKNGATGDHNEFHDTAFTDGIGGYEQSLMDHLKDGWRIVKMRFEITTEGGTGTRETQVTIKKFRWVYRTESGKKLIVPAVRPWDLRFDGNLIGMAP